MSVLLLLLVLSVFVTTGAALISGGQESLVVSSNATATLYAADGALELALSEYVADVDVDGDGQIGGVSNDGDDSNDPSIGGARVHVARNGTEFTATAVLGDAVRIVEVTVE